MAKRTVVEHKRYRALSHAIGSKELLKKAAESCRHSSMRFRVVGDREKANHYERAWHTLRGLITELE